MATAKPASSDVEGGGKSLQKKMGKAKPTLGKMSGLVHMLYCLLSLDESRKYQFGENKTEHNLFVSLIEDILEDCARAQVGELRYLKTNKRKAN